MIEITNDGAAITRTNYWALPHALGYCYLSINAGAVRVLVPPPLIAEITDALRTATRAALDVAGALSVGATRLHLILEDDTDTPYVLDLDRDQCDRLLPASEAGRWVPLIVYGPHGTDPDGVSSLGRLPLVIRLARHGRPDLSPVARAPE